MSLRIHNTLTRRLEALVPLVPGRVGMYVCGITVYDQWIACRFQDVQRAKENLPVGLQTLLNPYSGKWNHHYFDWTPHDAASDFHDTLSRILPQTANIEGVPA